MRKTPEERFWANVDTSGTCWLWTAGKNNRGYGSIRVAGKPCGAHRFAYELLVGPIPEGLYIDHICHNRACVNPAHLRSVTQKQNLENRTGAQTNSRSGIRGVTPTPNGKKWRASVLHNREQHYLGVFADISDADAAVTAKRLELFTHNDTDRNAA